MDDPFVTCLPKPSHRKTIESNREESDFKTFVFRKTFPLSTESRPFRFDTSSLVSLFPFLSLSLSLLSLPLFAGRKLISGKNGRKLIGFLSRGEKSRRGPLPAQRRACPSCCRNCRRTVGSKVSANRQPRVVAPTASGFSIRRRSFRLTAADTASVPFLNFRQVSVSLSLSLSRNFAAI